MDNRNKLVAKFGVVLIAGAQSAQKSRHLRELLALLDPVQPGHCVQL
jgi:hypothetical protein